MAIRNFKKLITIDITHGYYAAGACPDFELIPTEQCIKTLNKYRLKLIHHDSSLNIVYEQKEVVPETSPPSFESRYPIDQDVEFTFYMKLKNGFFSRFTELAAKTTPESIYYYTNSGSPVASLVQSDLMILPFTFDYAPKTTSASWDLSIVDENSVEVFSKTGNTNQDEIRVNIKDVPAGWYTIKEIDLEPSPDVTTTYLVWMGSGVRKSDVFGIVRLNEVAAFDDAEATEPILAYTVDFNYRTDSWQYVLDVSMTSSYEAIEIRDNGGYPIAPAPYTDQGITSPTSSDGTVHTFDFSGMPYYDQPRKGLSLVGVDYSVSPDVVTTLIEHLPTPSIQDPSAKIIMNI